MRKVQIYIKKHEKTKNTEKIGGGVVVLHRGVFTPPSPRGM